LQNDLKLKSQRFFDLCHETSQENRFVVTTLFHQYLRDALLDFPLRKRTVVIVLENRENSKGRKKLLYKSHNYYGPTGSKAETTMAQLVVWPKRLWPNW
jgi:hypothetical protein